LRNGSNDNEREHQQQRRPGTQAANSADDATRFDLLLFIA
jgi:hypothetical protein